MKLSRRLLMLLAVLLSFSLIAAACGDDDDTSTGDDTGDDADDGDSAADDGDDMADDAADDGDDMADDGDDMADDAADDGDDMADDGDDMADDMDHLGDGSLGVVVVEPGEEVQIRSLNAISGDPASLGIPNQRGVEIAVSDYGPIHGFDVTSGAGLDDTCEAAGGQAAAQQIVADEQIVGVIGTSCSAAATAASPLISDAGLVMISPSNTSPALTSDLQGMANSDYHVGYYRTAHNDLFQGAAMANFVFDELGFTTAAAIHDGDPYTQGLAQAFSDAFEKLGGTTTGFTAVNPGDTDMTPVLTEVAADNPQALFFPVFEPEGNFVAEQAGGVAGLEDTQLIGADGLLTDTFLELELSEDMYFSGPDVRFGTNTNESTGATPADVLAAFDEVYGEGPTAPFWGHSYDATTLLLDAIDAASWVDEDGNLNIDRAGIREHLDGVQGYSGIIGTINCDNFGDCGSQKITVVYHEDSTDIDTTKNNVVFEFAP